MKRMMLLLGLTVALVGVAQAVEITGALNVNKASVLEMFTLPGLSDVAAENIVTFREVNGPFDSLDELLKVEGVTPEVLEAIRSLLKLKGTSDLRVR